MLAGSGAVLYGCTVPIFPAMFPVATLSPDALQLSSRLVGPTANEPSSVEWRLDEFMGRLCELSGGPAGSTLTAVFRLVLDAQRRSEPVAWLMERQTCFFPPDVTAGGVDLDALAVVRLPSAADIPRAADQLARSGAFGLLVLDLGTEPIPLPLQSRLLGLAQMNETAILCLTEKLDQAPSLGSLISLRGHVVRSQPGPGQFLCEVRISKDKRRAPGRVDRELCCGPTGLR